MCVNICTFFSLPFFIMKVAFVSLYLSRPHTHTHSRTPMRGAGDARAHVYVHLSEHFCLTHTLYKKACVSVSLCLLSSNSLDQKVWEHTSAPSRRDRMRETYTRRYSCFPRSLSDRIFLCIYHLPFFCLSVSHTPMLPVEEAEFVGHEAQAHGDVPDRYSLTV